MNYCERIPAKTEAVTLSGTPVKIDCAGLEATVYANNADLYIKCSANTDTKNAFLLKSGNTLTLCGSFYLDAESGEARILYCRTL